MIRSPENRSACCCVNNVVDILAEDEEALYAGKMSAYQFMMNRITNLEITPAQLALDPCNAWSLRMSIRVMCWLWCLIRDMTITKWRILWMRNIMGPSERGQIQPAAEFCHTV